MDWVSSWSMNQSILCEPFASKHSFLWLLLLWNCVRFVFGLQTSIDLFNNSIVAVHGMGGGAASTWRHNKTQFLWLRDSLPSILKDLPYGTSARIWTFGYDSSVAFQPTFPGVHVFSEPLLEHCAVNRIGEDVRILSILLS